MPQCGHVYVIGRNKFSSVFPHVFPSFFPPIVAIESNHVSAAHSHPLSKCSSFFLAAAELHTSCHTLAVRGLAAKIRSRQYRVRRSLVTICLQQWCQSIGLTQKRNRVREALRYTVTCLRQELLVPNTTLCQSHRYAQEIFHRCSDPASVQICPQNENGV